MPPHQGHCYPAQSLRKPPKPGFAIATKNGCYDVRLHRRLCACEYRPALRQSATTHHGAYVDLAMQYPDIHVQRGARFVESGNLASAGASLLEWISPSGWWSATSAGCGKPDCHVLEYQGQGWLNPNSNSEFAGPIHQTADHPVCAVCGMPIDRSLSSTYKGRTYYFCVKDHKQIFDSSRKTSPPNDSSPRGLAIVRPALSPVARRTSHCIDRAGEPPESLRRSLDGFRQLLPENLVDTSSANGQRWLGACGIAPYTPQTTLHSWRDSPLYDATSLQLRDSML